jgi:cytidylate kinase
MTTMQPNVGAMKAITISRQYGSGAGEIAARLAARLNWRLVDREIVAQVAQHLGIPQQKAAARDEAAEGFIARVLSRIQFLPSVTTTTDSTYQVAPDDINEQQYREVLQRVVETAADSGQAVIAGRGGAAVLAERRDVLRVRIVAPLKARIAYVVLREGLDAAKAQARIREKDRDRAAFMQTLIERRVDDPELYDLAINTAVLSLDQAVELICLALQDKAQALSLPAQELGPARGLAPYPSRPADLRAPGRLTGTE